MRDFKFNLGDIVCPIVQADYQHANKMLILNRITDESAEGFRRYYVCSHYKLGDYIRQQLNEEEITLFRTS